MANKKYRIQKHFEVWVEREVKAQSLEAAVELAKGMHYEPFFEMNEGTELNDITQLPGTTVGERW